MFVIDRRNQSVACALYLTSILGNRYNHIGRTTGKAPAVTQSMSGLSSKCNFYAVAQSKCGGGSDVHSLIDEGLPSILGPAEGVGGACAVYFHHKSDWLMMGRVARYDKVVQMIPGTTRDQRGYSTEYRLIIVKFEGNRLIAVRTIVDYQSVSIDR